MSEEELRKNYRKWYELTEQCLTCKKWEDFRNGIADYPCENCDIRREIRYYFDKWMRIVETIGWDRARKIIDQETDELKRETRRKMKMQKKC